MAKKEIEQRESIASVSRSTERSLSVSRRTYLRTGGAAIATTGVAAVASGVMERHGIQFDRVLHAVEDLGMDPNDGSPINDAVEQAAAEHALVTLPPGAYRVDPSLVLHDGQVGFLGLGDSRRDVRFTVPAGASTFTFNFASGEAFLFENLCWDQGTDWDRLCGNRVDDGGTLKAVESELLGTEPHPPSVGDSGSAQFNLFHTGGGPNSLVLDDFRKHGPADSRDYPEGRNIVAAYEGSNVTVRNSDIRNTTVGQALYCNNTGGDVVVENNYFENTPHTAIRINGNGVARNNMIVIDPEGTYNHPDNRWRSEHGGMQPMRGIWVYDSKDRGSGEATLENNWVCHRSGTMMGGVVVDATTAGATVQSGGIRSGPGNVLVSAEPPVTIEDVHVTGNGSIAGNGVIRDSCVGQDISVSLTTENVTRGSCDEPPLSRGAPP